MKKLACIAMVVMIASLATAANNVITNYLPAYRMVPNTTTNAGDTGLSTGVTYFCFAASDVAQLSETSGTHTNGSFPQLMYSINDAFNTSWASSPASNKSTRCTLGKSSFAGTGTTVRVQYTFQTFLVVTTRMDVATE